MPDRRSLKLSIRGQLTYTNKRAQTHEQKIARDSGFLAPPTVQLRCMCSCWSQVSFSICERGLRRDYVFAYSLEFTAFQGARKVAENFLAVQFLQQFCRVRSIGSLPLENPADPRRTSAEPGRTLEETPAKACKDPLRVCWCTRGALQYPKGPKFEKFQSRLKCSISLEMFNLDLQNSPQKKSRFWWAVCLNILISWEFGEGVDSARGVALQ